MAVGEVIGAPARYWISEGPPGFRRWGFFIQFVGPAHPPVAVRDPARLPDPRAYPNPAHERLTFDAPAAWAGQDGYYVVTDVLGREVARDTLTYAAAPHELPVGTLPPGSYFVRLRRTGSAEWAGFSFVRG